MEVLSLDALSEAAWSIRDKAFSIGGTKVGCALLSESGRIYVGCNVEHRFRSHDVHSEVNAITTMVAGGDKKIVAILIAAERAFFTPCGSCMDWIMQFGDEKTVVAFQPAPGAPLHRYTAGQLMPYYPH